MTALASLASTVFAQDSRPSHPERRAVAFLVVEVPKWTHEHACYSCHNNGDAARALMAAMKSGDVKDPKPLADTLKFLSNPELWDDNGPDGPFKDKQLARIQFAAALVDAHRAKLVADRTALAKAAAMVAELQAGDGSWPTDAQDNLGSPATYGRHLATLSARRTLAAADEAKYRAAIVKADAWFEQTPANNILQAAVTLWSLANNPKPAALARREQCLKLIRNGESPEGGWGPFVTSPSEAFDTAIVLLALGTQKHSAEINLLIHRGRQYLILIQESDGGWPATTRPSGAESYAQRLSTTGWATQALFATRGAVQDGSR